MKKGLSYLIFCLLISLTILGGALIFKQKQYAFLSLCVTVFSCVPFFLHFEKKAKQHRAAHTNCRYGGAFGFRAVYFCAAAVL